MFAPSVVGTANAITGGWGNMGGGITYLVMPAIYDGIRHHLSHSKSWRVVFVVPAGICILMALADLLFATDTPHGDWLKLRAGNQPDGAQLEASPPKNEKEKEQKEKGEDEEDSVVVNVINAGDDEETISDVKRDEPPLVAFIGFLKMLAKPPVLIMIATYACSFGIELAIDNIIGQVFQLRFKLNPSKAAYIGSIFGLLNLFSRLSGGLFSDYMASRLHMPGRILALLIAMLFEGAFLIGFSFGMVSLSTSIILMVFFSFFVQHVCGSTFAVVPFIDPANNGKVMGIVGAGGNLGGLIFNLMFRSFGTQYDRAFLCLGCVCLGVATIGCGLLRVQNKTVWHLLRARRA
jgi:NNP family nitrate/nitrite transporter-like MFS transporter